MDIKSKPEDFFYQTNQFTGEVEKVDMMTGATISLSRLAEYDRHRYTLEMSEAICDLVREGLTLTKISKLPGMPSSSVIFRWKTLHPDFMQKLDAAKIDRAEAYHDRVNEVIDKLDNVGPDRSPLESLKVQGLKWLAEVGNPDKFGKKTKISGDATQPITFVLDTGIHKQAPTKIEADLVREQKAIIDTTAHHIIDNASEEVTSAEVHPADFVAAQDLEE